MNGSHAGWTGGIDERVFEGFRELAKISCRALAARVSEYSGDRYSCGSIRGACPQPRTGVSINDRCSRSGRTSHKVYI